MLPVKILCELPDKKTFEELRKSVDYRRPKRKNNIPHRREWTSEAETLEQPDPNPPKIKVMAPGSKSRRDWIPRPQISSKRRLHF